MTSTSSKAQTYRTAKLLLLALALTILLTAWRSASRAMRMNTGDALTSEQIDHLKPGAEAKIVLELTSATSQRLEGTILLRQTDTIYKRGVAMAQVEWGANTGIVMGKGEDLHPRAVIQASGVVTTERTIDAQQIVILTGYVHLR